MSVHAGQYCDFAESEEEESGSIVPYESGSTSLNFEDPSVTLPQETFALILRYVEPWDEGCFLVSKRWHALMKHGVPFRQVRPPVLPCSAHLEFDVRSSTNRIVARSIYTLNQQLWDLPMSIQRFEWVPGQFCRPREDLEIDASKSYYLWKKVMKCLTTETGLSPECPHYFEMKQGRRSDARGSGSTTSSGIARHAHFGNDPSQTLRGYISTEESARVLQIARSHCSVASPRHAIAVGGSRGGRFSDAF